MEFHNTFRLGLSIDGMQAVFDKWELVISKFSEIEPELLLNLLTGVLDLIDSRTRVEEDACRLSPYDDEKDQIQLHLSLFSRLLEILHQLKHVQSDKPDVETCPSLVLPKSILLELVRRCLLISEPGNDTLFNSALTLARMIGDERINERLKKLSVVFSSSPAGLTEDGVSCDVNLENSTSLHDKDIQKATTNLDVLKSKLAKGGRDRIPSQSPSSNAGTTSRWGIAESWNPCPIGMLPRRLGSSGCLPGLKYGHKQRGSCDTIYKDTEKDTSTSMLKENWDMRHCCVKRGASSDLEELDTTCAKRVRENVDGCHYKAGTNDGGEEIDNNVCTDDTVNGCLMINGVMHNVSEEEVKKIKSDLLNLLRKDITLHK